MPVRVRYYCLVMPSDGQQLGYDYLEALSMTGLGVRALPIGPAFLMAGPWPKVMHLFLGDMPGARYVNVVCAPLSLSLGFATSRAQAGAPVPPHRLPGTTAIELPGDEKDIVYQPLTAISGLFTVGVPNIAITRPPRAAQGRPSESELTALSQYDMIICPSQEDVVAFRGLEVGACYVPPAAGELARLLEALL